ncbi:hypothetical protein K3G39_07070 [Pontibacter sp. HSC-14F20]|uniref:hypothetical protein n=1 Tax=Pontibacter sp. HSC-14F20 TaxID=2864136 RepID=UPI001C73800C|nr:hypothetical protein [Pontibacter sp. HSC-14F20]MBX0332995.1 hypothetical protein [Pontibacter sp. HSC-14F20]
MSDILQYIASADSQALLEMNKAVTNHLLFNHQLIAGFKVRNKIGGPIMLVHGFIHNHTNLDHRIDSRVAVGSYAKMQLNKDGLTYKQIYNRTNTSDDVPPFIFYKDLFSTEPDSAGSNLLIVCKYWSDKENDFVLIVEKLHELKIVKE